MKKQCTKQRWMVAVAGVGPPAASHENSLNGGKYIRNCWSYPMIPRILFVNSGHFLLGGFCSNWWVVLSISAQFYDWTLPRNGCVVRYILSGVIHLRFLGFATHYWWLKSSAFSGRASNGMRSCTSAFLQGKFLHKSTLGFLDVYGDSKSDLYTSTQLVVPYGSKYTFLVFGSGTGV